MISQAMAEFDPAFVIHSGDMVNDGRLQTDWDSWFTDVNDHWVGDNGLTIPVLPVLGNHEYPSDSSSKYFEQFALPGNERWFSYDWGPDIHITCLDCYSSPSGEQLAWLEDDLASHEECMWKIVVFHEPPFVSGSHEPWVPGLTYWVPLFDKYHVNLVFNGHEHNYQRSYPLNWTASQTEAQDFSNGTVYVVSGGWGAPLYTPTWDWYMAFQSEEYHFCLVDIFRNGTLHLQAKDNNGVTFDEVTIEAGVSAAHLLLTVDPFDGEYVGGEQLSFRVSVFDEQSPAFDSTLSLTVSGPNGYYVFDFQNIAVAADCVEEFSFDWVVPEAAGTYVVEVGLMPAQLTAYDAVWLKVS